MSKTRMTVEELIEELKKVDPKLVVYRQDREWGGCPVVKVTEIGVYNAETSSFDNAVILDS